MCNCSYEVGHWKSDCLMLKAKKQHAGGGHVKPAALAASISGPVDLGSWQDECRESGMTDAIDESYLPFILDGFILEPDQFIGRPILTVDISHFPNYRYLHL